MTREESIEIIQKLIGRFKSDSRTYKALEMAIQALSQETCDDAISREDAEQMFRNIRSHLKPQDYKSAEEFNTRDLMLLNAEQMIHALPSVTQKSVIEDIKAEIKAEMEEHRDIDDFSKGVGYGLRSAIGIIERCEDGK